VDVTLTKFHILHDIFGKFCVYGYSLYIFVARIVLMATL